MADALPAQLRWRDFVRALGKLGYRLHKSHSGSARTFISETRQPRLVTFHEPHGSSPIRPGTLREYVRKLEVSREEFLRLLE
jgi:hypothetical protein